MTDYIDRNAAIETLCQMQWHDEDGYPIEDYSDKRKLAEDWMNQIPAADVAPVPRWVSIAERLPEEPYGCLLIVWDNPRGGGEPFLNYLPYFAGWDGEQWNDADGDTIPFEVAYWMPLPKLPKEGEE